MKLLSFALFVVAGCTGTYAADGAGAQPFSLTIGVEGRVSGIEAPHVIKVGSSLSIKIATTNHAKRKIDCSRFHDDVTGLDQAYEYDIRHNGNPVKKSEKITVMSGGFVAMGCTLKLGESTASSSLLTTAYDLGQPGEYTIQLARAGGRAFVLDFADPIRQRDAPFFAKQRAGMGMPARQLAFQACCISGVHSRPCKERKDGAPRVPFLGKKIKTMKGPATRPSCGACH